MKIFFLVLERKILWLIFSPWRIRYGGGRCKVGETLSNKQNPPEFNEPLTILTLVPNPKTYLGSFSLEASTF